MTIRDYLHSTKPPWLGVLRVDEEESLLTFLGLNDADIYVCSVDGRKCRTKNDLMTEFSTKLKFPPYFGHNWDAFEDCLQDLRWLPLDQRGGGYAIFVTHADKLLIESPADYKTFTEIVKSAGEHWATSSSTASDRAGVPFHVLLISTRNSGRERHWGAPELDVQVPR